MTKPVSNLTDKVSKQVRAAASLKSAEMLIDIALSERHNYGTKIIINQSRDNGNQP